MKNEQVPDSQQTGNEKNPDGGELGRVMIDGMRVYSRVLGYIKSAQRRCSRKIDSSTALNVMAVECTSMMEVRKT